VIFRISRREICVLWVTVAIFESRRHEDRIGDRERTEFTLNVKSDDVRNGRDGINVTNCPES